MGDKMKTEYIRIRTTPRRSHKLKLLAEQKEYSVTRLIEDWIDSLPDPVSRQDKGKQLAFIPWLKHRCSFLSQLHLQGFSAFLL